MIDVLGPEKRRRRTTQEKIAIVQQSFEPGMTVSLVARQHGVAASQLFLWRKQYQEGSLTAVAAGEQVVPASELAAAMKQIKELRDHHTEHHTYWYRSRKAFLPHSLSRQVW